MQFGRGLPLAVIGAVMGAGLVACGPSGAPAGGGEVAAGEAGFTGEWHVTGSIVGPWFTGPDFAPEADGDVVATTLALTDTSAAGPAALTCAAATFEAKTLPAEGLFEGRVPDRYVAKASLGVDQDEVPALVQTCSEAGKAPVTYNMVGKDRMLAAVGDLVYQFDRGPAKAAPAAAPATAPAAPAPAAPATPAAPQ